MNTSIFAIAITTIIFAPIAYIFNIYLDPDNHKSLIEWSALIALSACSGIYAGDLHKFISNRNKD